MNFELEVEDCICVPSILIILETGTIMNEEAEQLENDFLLPQVESYVRRT